MSNKQSDSTCEEKSPFNDFDEEAHLITDLPRNKRAVFIERVELEPGTQQRILLGNFVENKPPKGFSVEVSPDPNPAGSVLTEVTSLGTAKRYRLILHIANYSTKPVAAEVWQL